jgi:hypothetical protein
MAIANNFSTPNVSPQRIIAIGGLVFALLLLAIGIAYWVKKWRKSSRAASEVEKLQSGAVRPTGSPVYATPSGTVYTPPSTGQPVDDRPDIADYYNYTPPPTKPSDLPTWMVELLWQTNESHDSLTRAYKCEVSNMILSLDDNSVRQYKAVYLEWYGMSVVTVVQGFGFCGSPLEYFTGCPNDCPSVVARLIEVGN